MYAMVDALVNGGSVLFQLWDTVGQERFRSMAVVYYRSLTPL
jgi:GTPase SAR1 family protein